MLNKIKSLFGFGSATPVEVAALVVAPMPVGIEAVVATPVAKPKAPAKPKAEKTPKVAAMKVPAVKKPRVTKAK